MLTWQGDFGVLDKAAILGSEWPSTADVIAVLKAGDHVRLLAAGLWALMQRLQEQFGLENTAGRWSCVKRRIISHAR